jgi:hypothetical protein
VSQPVSKSASALGSGVLVQKQKAGVYTVLLVLSLLAILVGCALLYAVIQRYDGQLAPGAQAQPNGRATAYQLIDVRTASCGECDVAAPRC